MMPGKKKKRFGMMAIEKDFVTVDHVIEALTVQTREGIQRKKLRTIGEILLDLGYMKSWEIAVVLQETFEPRFGEIATSKGLITLEQFIEAMGLQVREEAEKGVHRLVGEILIDLGFMTPHDVEKVLREMKRTTR